MSRSARALALAALGLVAACRRGEQGDALLPGGLHGAILRPALPKPDFRLVDESGRPFDFRRETDGYLTFLYFGYTHCADVCPVQMANLAGALHQLPPASVQRMKVVFVTTDPARDSAARLRQWLGFFDPGFIGLTGTPAALRAAQLASGLPPAEREDIPGGGYGVGHAAQVLVFTPDDSERAQYPFGIRQEDWAHDLPRLLTLGSGR